MRYYRMAEKPDVRRPRDTVEIRELRSSRFQESLKRYWKSKRQFEK